MKSVEKPKIELLTPDTINEMFNDYDPRVKDMLYCVLEDLQHQYKIIPNYFRIILELLSTQLDIYFKAKDKYRSNKEHTGDNRTKSTEYVQMQGTHDKILTIMRELGMTVVTKKKLEKLSTLSSSSTIDDVYDAMVA